MRSANVITQVTAQFYVAPIWKPGNKLPDAECLVDECRGSLRGYWWLWRSQSSGTNHPPQSSAFTGAGGPGPSLRPDHLTAIIHLVNGRHLHSLTRHSHHLRVRSLSGPAPHLIVRVPLCTLGPISIYHLIMKRVNPKILQIILAYCQMWVKYEDWLSDTQSDQRVDWRHVVTRRVSQILQIYRYDHSLVVSGVRKHLDLHLKGCQVIMQVIWGIVPLSISNLGSWSPGTLSDG